MRFESMSATLRCMVQKNTPLTVQNFVDLNWFGSKSIQELEGEDLLEVQEFKDAVAELESGSN